MAATVGKGLRRGEAGWRRLIDAYSDSSETVADYCRRVGCCTASFYLWRRRLEAGAEALTVGGSADGGGFVDLGPLDSGGRTGFRLNLTLEFGNGIRLHLVRS